MNIKTITYDDTKDIIMNYHYAHRMPSISFAFGLFDSDQLVGLVTFGSPASASLCRGVAGEEFKSNVIELNRLYIKDEVKDRHNLASQLVSFGLRALKPYNKIVVSYSDHGMNHNGYIYQATNFMFTGTTKPRTDKYTGGKHSRHYDKQSIEVYRQLRTAKNRYIYVSGNKRFKREVLKNFKYPILEYPKESNTNYKVGDSIPVTLINTKTKELIQL